MRFLCLALLITLFAFASDSSLPPTAILGAITEEVELIRERITGKSTQTFLGVPFTTGTLMGRSVVLVETGVGKVNAAMTTTLLLDHFSPREVIFTGIAGSLNPNLLPGDVVIAAKTAQHDLGYVTAEGFKSIGARNPIDKAHNPVFFQSDLSLVELSRQAAKKAVLTPLKMQSGATRLPKVILGIIVTGDIFVASEPKKQELRERFSADAVEMEGAAVAQVCFQQGIPFVILRSLIDKADSNAPADRRTFLKTAAHNTSEIVFQLAGLLAEVKTETKTEAEARH